MRKPTRRRLLAAASALPLLLAGCLSDEAAFPTPVEPPEYDLEPEWGVAEGSPLEADVTETTTVSGLESPWDLTFADEEVYLTERSGGVLRFERELFASETDLTADDAETAIASDDLPDWTDAGEGGTLGVDAHPEYPEPAVLFVFHTAEDGDLENRVARIDLDDGSVETILDGIPAASTHNGGRLAVGPDDALWLTTGDAEEPALTQDPASLAGAVLRVTLDGEPADGNPDFGDGSDPRTYTLGHRNPQGLAFAPDGVPLLAEHGPQARDEVVALRPGGNYGWDAVRGGPDDSDYESYGDHEEVTPPIVNTGVEETWAPSGIAFYDDDAIPEWRDRLFVCGLISETLYAVTLEYGDDTEGGGETDETDAVRYDDDWLDDRFAATATPLYGGEYGRLRSITQGPDGALYLLTSNRDGRATGEFPTDDDDRVVRIESA